MADLNELKPVGKLNPFAKFCCTIGNLPTSYMISLTYEEQLLWLCKYLEDTVIPAVNTNAQALQELQELYVVLKNYVDNYFENLDVQEEINNKLDEMVESGYFDNLLNNYLNLIKVYDTTENMILDAENIVVGQIIKTLGYYNKNDMGGTSFIITDEEKSNRFQITLNNGKYAEIIVNNNYYNVLECGAKNDFSTDTSPIMNKIINILGNTGGTIYFPKGTYKFESTIITDYSSITILGENKINTILKYTGDEYLFKLGNNKGVAEFTWNHLNIISELGGGIYFYRDRIYTSKVYDVQFDTKKEGILFESDGAYNEFERISFYRTYEPTCFVKIDGKVNVKPNYLYFNNCYFEGGNKDFDTAIKLGSCLFIWFNECDFCNFSDTAIKIVQPGQSGATQHIYFKNCTLFNNHNSIGFENNVTVYGQINFEDCYFSGDNIFTNLFSQNLADTIYISNCFLYVETLCDTTRTLYIANTYVATIVTDYQKISRACYIPLVQRITVPVNNNQAQNLTINISPANRKYFNDYLQAMSMNSDVVVNSITKVSSTSATINVTNNSSSQKTVSFLIV